MKRVTGLTRMYQKLLQMQQPAPGNFPCSETAEVVLYRTTIMPRRYLYYTNNELNERTNNSIIFKMFSLLSVITAHVCVCLSAGHYNPGAEGRSQNPELRFRIQIVIFTIFIHVLFYFLHVHILHL